MSILNKIKEIYGKLDNHSIGQYLSSHNISSSLEIMNPYLSYRVGISTLPIKEFGEIVQYYEDTSNNKRDK